MHGLNNEHNLSTSRWTTPTRSEMAEKVREADAHSPKPWVARPVDKSWFLVENICLFID